MTTRKHFTTRLPDTLATALAQQAETNHRSANAELVAILQREFSPRMFERPVSGTPSTLVLSYELKDNPGFEYEFPVSSPLAARLYLQDKADMVEWASVEDANGVVVADTSMLI